MSFTDELLQNAEKYAAEFESRGQLRAESTM
jgi:hypothetical protein